MTIKLCPSTKPITMMCTTELNSNTHPQLIKMSFPQYLKNLVDMYMKNLGFDGPKFTHVFK